jgi:hypothetical protein
MASASIFMCENMVLHIIKFLNKCDALFTCHQINRSINTILSIKGLNLFKYACMDIRSMPPYCASKVQDLVIHKKFYNLHQNISKIPCIRNLLLDNINFLQSDDFAYAVKNLHHLQRLVINKSILLGNLVITSDSLTSLTIKYTEFQSCHIDAPILTELILRYNKIHRVSVLSHRCSDPYRINSSI